MRAFCIASLFLITILISGCGATNPVGAASGSSSSTTGSSSTTADPGGADSIDTSKFTIAVDNPEYGSRATINRIATSDSNGSLTRTTSCVADPSDSSGKDVYCVVNIEELDLYMHGAKLIYNFPSSKCDIGYFQPYWFYSHQAGVGPTTVAAAKSKDGKYITTEQYTSGGSLAGNANVYITKDKISCSSRYDHSVSDTKAPNCCQGTYNLYEVKEKDCLTTSPCTAQSTVLVPGAEDTCYLGGTDATAAGAQAWELQANLGTYENRCWEANPASVLAGSGTSGTVVSENVDWGGSFGNCAAGPGKSDKWTTVLEEYKTPTGFYKTIGSAGYIKGEFEVKPLENYRTFYSFHSANFYTPATIIDWYTSGLPNTSIPVALRDLVQTSSSEYTSFPRPNPFYEFQCLSRAGEVKARIRLMIQEWNDTTQFETYIAGGTGDPDTNDAWRVPEDSPFGEDPIETKNDLIDWKSAYVTESSITIAASNNNLEFTVNGDTVITPTAVTSGTYTPRGLATALSRTMTAAAGGDTITVTYLDTGINANRYKITTSGDSLELLCANAASDICTTLGFTATDKLGARTYFSDTILSVSDKIYAGNTIEVIAGSNDILRVTYDTGGGATSTDVTIDPGFYEGPTALATNLASKLTTAVGKTVTVNFERYGSNFGKFKIAAAHKDIVTLSLLWNHANTTSETILGFSNAADDTGDMVYYSDTNLYTSSSYLDGFDTYPGVVFKASSSGSSSSLLASMATLSLNKMFTPLLEGNPVVSAFQTYQERRRQAKLELQKLKQEARAKRQLRF